MNKSFKVVFNKARGALMVVNEVTSSVQAKGTKTVIAAAVATLMAGAAVASVPDEVVITNDNLSDLGKFGPLFVEGDGKHLSVQTNGSLGTLIDQIKDFQNATGWDKLGKLADIFDPTEDHALVVGISGGEARLDLNSTKISEGRLNITKHGDTSIQIGDTNKSSNPLVVGVVSGDVILSNGHGSTIDRVGNSSLTISSGNVAGVIGGSAGILIGNPEQAKDGSVEVSKTTIDATSLMLNGSANVGGFFGGSVAVGTNQSNIEGIVKNGTNIVIDMNDDAKPGNLDGLVIGGFGGGLALA